VSFDFTLDVSASLGLSDIAVTNRDTGLPVTVNGLSYSSNRGTFDFGGSALPDGNYRAVLSAAGVTHALGAALPGDVIVDFFVFAGDANHNRTIDIQDFAFLAGNFNMPGTFSQGDFNYSGVADLEDFAILASKWNSTLAEPSGGRAVAGMPPLVSPALKSVFGTARISRDESLWDRTQDGQPPLLLV
jgi:hypothetical protein